MKKLFTTTALLATMATSAIAAQSDTVYATITHNLPLTMCQLWVLILRIYTTEYKRFFSISQSLII